ncbi:GNAT family N-acetyltransferase [Nitratireductor indicus]|uniref:GNAT family N-acetyltransferase n=1 Tax=Nitratireductor indicus TaxID=721133 RepID=UPI0028752BB6|nr:GNAT family N-acetyltransferase [Nitratireductor indicus]MDS1135329.1 GNAT family N-acetyltransferase [Nitratireductor indicus]
MKMQFDPVIRAYERGDSKRILDIWLAASHVGHPFLGDEVLLRQRQIVEELYLDQAEIWVAEQAGQVVGFIGLLDTFIGGLFVDPQRHGGGHARTLVEHAFRLKPFLELEVYAANPVAPGFYRHLGFEEVERRSQDDDGRPFELIRMRWG